MKELTLNRFSVSNPTLKSSDAKRKRNDINDENESIPEKKPRERESDILSISVACSSSSSLGTSSTTKTTVS